MLYIVTTRYRLAENECHERGFSPHNRDKVRIITRPENCQGVHLKEGEDESIFLAIPDDWEKRATHDLSRAWQHIIATSRARTT